MTLNAGSGTNTVGSMLVNSGTGANSGAGQSTRFLNVALTATNNYTQGTMYLSLPNNFFFEGCTFTGGGSAPIGGAQLFFDHCTFNIMFDGVVLNVKNGLNGFAVTSCTAQNEGAWVSGSTSTNTVVTSTTSKMITLAGTSGFAVGYEVVGNGIPNNDYIASLSGSTVTLSTKPTTGEPIGTTFVAVNSRNVGIGLFIKGLNYGGPRNNFYYANNTTRGLANENVTENWGEQMSFENNLGFYYGTPTSASGTAMTFDPQTMQNQGFVVSGSIGTQLGYVNYANLTGPNGLIAAIIKGTGLGQTRNVASYSLATGAVNLATPWKLPPDSTSTLVLGWYAKGVVIYQNNLSGQPADCAATNNTSDSHRVCPTAA